MKSCLQPFRIPVLAFLLFAACGRGDEPLTTTYFYDEESLRYLTLRQTSATGVEVLMR